jgi:quercetin dioxygenase-like cupin family protein
MKTLTIAVGLAVFPLLASAQDVVKVDPGHYKVLIDNAAVRVLRVSVPTGGKSAMHSHPDALLVPLTTGKGRFTMPDGKSEDRELVKEVASYTPAATHASANVGTSAVDAILVEFKTKAPGTATIPAARPGLQQTVLVESPRAVAYKTTTAPDFQEPAGSTHEYDQVVIALGAGELSLAVEGQAPVTKWQRGDVHFIARGAKHQAKNTGGKPVDVIIVAVK